MQSERSKTECPVPRRQSRRAVDTRVRVSHTARRTCALPQREGTMRGNEPGRNTLQLAVRGPRGWKPRVVPRRRCSPACRPHGGILWDRGYSLSEARQSVVEMDGQAQGRDQSVPTAPRPTGTPVSWALTARGSLTLRSTLQKQGGGPPPSTEETRVQWRVEATFPEPPS